MSLNPPITEWTNRVVWIVGASSGIGQALASALHALGARVAVSARQAAALDAWVNAHAGSVAAPLDVTNEASIADAHRSVVSQLGPVDVMVYAAGHYRPQRASQLDVQQAEQHMAVNYLGAWRTLAQVLPPMQATGRGHVVFIASVAGYRGLPKALAYGPTKAALNNWADGLYHDLRGQGVAVTVVNPGFVQTPLTAQNDFEMPALITPNEAAQHIVRGLADGDYEIHFPKRFTLWLKLCRWLPHRWYFAVMKRVAA